jgi:two-component sensor histidine kinase
LIVNELISNALKHAFPGGRRGAIWIDFAHDSDNHATLTVCDDGVGIPEKFSFDTSETLGVQLVYLLTGQLGGTVELESKQPATFVVRFPLAL